jgi:hypothetical protein
MTFFSHNFPLACLVLYFWPFLGNLTIKLRWVGPRRTKCYQLWPISTFLSTTSNSCQSVQNNVPRRQSKTFHSQVFSSAVKTIHPSIFVHSAVHWPNNKPAKAALLGKCESGLGLASWCNNLKNLFRHRPLIWRGALQMDNYQKNEMLFWP